MTFCPAASETDALQEVVPDAVPDPPVAAFDHFTLLTPTLSAAVPPIASGEAAAVHVEAVVGAVMVTEGGEVSRAAWTPTVTLASSTTDPAMRPALFVISPPRICAYRRLASRKLRRLRPGFRIDECPGRRRTSISIEGPGPNVNGSNGRGGR
jgi:hypothetical protein